jgi:hypothetical protein
VGEAQQLALLGADHSRAAVVVDGDPNLGTTSGRRGRAISIVDLRDGREQGVPMVPAPQRIAAQPDGHQLAVLTDDGQLVLLDERGIAEPSPVRLNGFAVELAYAPDGRRLAVSRGDGQVLIIDVALRRIVHATALTSGAEYLLDLAWDPTGRVLAATVAAPSGGGVFRPQRVAFWSIDADGWARMLCRLLTMDPDPPTWQQIHVLDVCGRP